MVKIIVDDAEFLTDALDRGAHIAPITFGSLAREKAFALHDVIEFPIADIQSGRSGKPAHDVELREAEIDALSLPQRPVDVEAQLERTEPHRLTLGVADITGRACLRARQNELDALQENCEGSMLFDEVDRAD